jgi:hypothetical protein
MKKTTELNPYGWNRITDHAALWGVTKGRISQLVKEGRLETNGKEGRKLRVRGYLANWKPAEVGADLAPTHDRAGLSTPAHNAQARSRATNETPPAKSASKVSEPAPKKQQSKKAAEKVPVQETPLKVERKVSSPPPLPEMWMTYEEARAEKMKQDARLAKLKVQEKDFAFRANYCNKIASAFVRAFVPLKQHLIELDLNKKQIAVLAALVDGCLAEFEREVQKEINGDSAESEDEE